jgi:peptide/nickel transport system substrate-binding protein
VTLTVSPTAGLPCIIATAAYGSEIAPEVYFLRFFRDNSIQTSFAGSQFMNVFNAWYYSFSPTVAEHVKNNMAFRNVVQAAVYPLLASLYVAQWSYSGLSFAPELAVVVAGLVASSLIGVIYFAPITLLVVRVARRKQIRIGDINKPLMIAWISSIALIVIAEIAMQPTLMMAGTAAFVLSTIIVATKMTVTQAQRYLPK